MSHSIAGEKLKNEESQYSGGVGNLRNDHDKENDTSKRASSASCYAQTQVVRLG